MEETFGLDKLITDYFAVSLYFPSLDSDIRVLPQKSNIMSEAQRNIDICNSVNRFLGKFHYDDYFSVFGYGVAVNANKQSLVFFPSFGALSYCSSDNPSWNDPEFGMLLFLGRTLDCQTVVFTNVMAENEWRTNYAVLCFSYGFCDERGYSPTKKSVFDAAISVVAMLKRTVAVYVMPNVRDDPEMSSLYLLVCLAVEVDDNTNVHDVLLGHGFAPNTRTEGVLPYVFTSRASIDRAMLAFQHVKQQWSEIERSPVGGAIVNAKWYKGGQFVPGKRKE